MKRIIPFIIGLCVLVLLILKVGVGDLIHAISLADGYLLLISFLILVITMLIKNVRWNFLLSKVSRCGFRKSSLIYFVGQLTNEIMPIGSGELVRIYWVKREDRTSFAKPLSSIIIERVFDLLILLTVTILGINIILNLQGFSHFLILSTFIILSLILLAIQPRLINPFLKILPKRISLKISKKLEEFMKARTSYSRDALSLTLGVSVLAWLVETCAQATLLLSFGYALPFVRILAIVTISWLLGTFSFLPGGLGAREAVFAYFLTLSNVPLGIAITVSLVYRAFVYLAFGMLVLVFLLINRMSFEDFAS